MAKKQKKETELQRVIHKHMKHWKAGEHSSQQQAFAISYSQLGLSRKGKRR